MRRAFATCGPLPNPPRAFDRTDWAPRFVTSPRVFRNGYDGRVASTTRRCPLCGTSSPESLCPKDGMATLLVGAPPSDPGRIRAGTMIGGRYRVEQRLGSGGFGVVFSAIHTGTGQKVAVKVLSGTGRAL